MKQGRIESTKNSGFTHRPLQNRSEKPNSKQTRLKPQKEAHFVQKGSQTAARSQKTTPSEKESKKSPKRVPKRVQKRTQKGPKNHTKTDPEGSKTDPRGPKRLPRRTQEGPRCPKRGKRVVGCGAPRTPDESTMKSAGRRITIACAGKQPV